MQQSVKYNIAHVSGHLSMLVSQTAILNLGMVMSWILKPLTEVKETTTDTIILLIYIVYTFMVGVVHEALDSDTAK